MADPRSKKSSIPQWQQQQPGNTPSDPSTSAPPSQSSDDTTPRPALLEQATKFLEDEAIRDASTDRKVEFLESKGLHKGEIESLLGVSRDDEASGDTTTSASSATTTNGSDQNGSRSDSSEDVSQKLQTRASPSTSSPSSSSTTTTKSAPSRDVPPIITYPEFLVKQPKPPPLVTFNSVFYTLYAAAGLGASIYGASEYLVKPMLANLTSARHDFAQTTTENLRALNEKLEQNVSTIPPSHANKGTEDSDREDEDADSVTSDPTELFHRDIATQTSPQDITPAASSEKPADAEAPTPTAAVNNHLKRLEVINSHLREFADTEKESTTLDDTMRNSLKDVHYYLDSLVYSSPSYGSSSGYGTWNSPNVSTSSGTTTGIGKGEEDAIAGFKAEIRGVKGALLSAKNFPSSRGGRINR